LKPSAYLVAGLIAGAVAVAGNFLFRDRADGLSIDWLTWLAHETGLEQDADAKDARAIVIAIDEETYRRPPFQGVPQALWTPQLATVLNAVLDGGAKVVGLDAIFSTSASSVVPNYDKDLLQVLSRGAKEGRIVLGAARHQAKPIAPARAQMMAVGGAQNVRSVNAFEDADGFIRRMPLGFVAPGGFETSFAAEIYRRASGRDLKLDSGGVTIDGKAIRGVVGNQLTLDFLPTRTLPEIYSFADLFACAEAGNRDYFSQAFAGRTILVGAVLDIEDRKLTSRRLVKSADGGNYAERCVHPVMTELFNGTERDAIPGVYLHATVIDDLFANGGLDMADQSVRLSWLAILALLSGFCVLRFGPRLAALGLAVTSAAWIAWSTYTLVMGALVLPLVAGTCVILATAPLIIVYRIGLVERGRRRLRRMFALYLPEPELERLTARDQLPALGGEERSVTILFSDIAGYSGLSESLTPAELVADLNRYFGRMTEIVQGHGGFVDKFIGDGILAVFGAPLAEGNHALAGVRAALDMIAALETDPEMTLNKAPIRIRIGLHTDKVIVGNIGAPSRFNYTVVGDGVNLASRLEGVGKPYHVPIIASGETREAVGDAIRFRELDQVRVVGRDRPVTLYQPLPPDAQIDPRFATALALWRKGDFAAAASLFGSLQGDEAAQAFAARAAAYATRPPEGWDGIVNLTQK
jgi:adenylate cyclase